MSEALIAALYPITSRVRTDVTAIKRDGKTTWTREPLTEERLRKHLNGGLPRGVCPIKEAESTTQVAVLDFDSHKGETAWDDMLATAKVIIAELEILGMRPIPFRSSGGKGIHLFILWHEPQDAYSVRKFLKDIMVTLGYTDGAGGVAKKQIEIFPKQDKVPIGGFGNQFFLPLAGESVPLDSLSNLKPMEKEDALKLVWHSSASVPFCEPPASAVHKERPEGQNITLEDIQEAVEEMRKMLAFIDPDIDRDHWIKIGMAIHYETGGSVEGLLLWDVWSSGCLWKNGEEVPASYINIEDLEYQWERFKEKPDRPVTLGTIKIYARKAGWQEVKAADEFANLSQTQDKTDNNFAIISADEFANGPDPEWIIYGVLPEAELAMVIGVSGAAKTFIVIDMVACIVLGKPWCGRKVKQGRVIYIAAEGASGIRKRIKAYKQKYNITFGNDFGIINAAPNLLSDDYADVAREIMRFGDVKVIVVDTLAQTTPGGNENASEDMGKLLSHCKKIHRETGALVLLIHHVGKDQARGARGWSGMKAAMDAEIEVSQKSDVRCATITKQKDGETGEVFAFNLIPVVIGMDTEGKEITSCVINYLDPHRQLNNKKPKGKWQQILIKILENMTSPDQPKIAVEKVIDELASRIPHDSGRGKRDRRRERAGKVISDMDEELLMTKDNVVWLPQYHKTPQNGICGNLI